MTATRRLFSYSFGLGALLLTAAPAFASTFVKVECNGPCSNVTRGQACSSAGTTTPVAVSCDAPANPGLGNRVGCGTGTATCTPFGDYAASDQVSAYCDDTSGNDAVVICP
jgi:hypothetical protein